MSTRLLACAIALSFVACAESSPGELTTAVETSTDELIYGSDDRREYFELTSPTDLMVADATTALMQSSDLTWNGSAWQANTSGTFGASYSLCSSEPYRTQPNPAFCSGFQVGPDLIATAGHCIDTTSCATTMFAFGFRMDDASTLRSTLPADDVYSCASIVARAETSTLDYAVVRVDRPIVGHEPLEIRRTGTIATGAPVAVSGHPAGIPLKVAGGATVRGNSAADYFESNLDSYGGNSGSPVFDPATGIVEGILVRGNADFVLTGRGRNRCRVSNECSDSGCPGWEDVTRATTFASFVPESEPCLTDGECDDGNPCNGFETCDAGACVAGAAASCTDLNACTDDSCLPLDPSTWECTNTIINCNDGDPCTVDSCDPITGCASTPVLCGPSAMCVDGACVAVPECAPVGGSCSSNGDCCSGKCHRKHGFCQ